MVQNETVMRRCSVLLGLQVLVFAWITTAPIPNAHAETHDAASAPTRPSSDTHEDERLLAPKDIDEQTSPTEEKAPRTPVRKARTHPRATEILSGQPVQPRPQRPTPPREAPPKRPVYKDTGLIQGDPESALQALEFYKAQDVELSLRSDKRLIGTVDFFTDGAVLIITRSGNLHVIALQDIETIDPAPAAVEEKPSVALTDEDREQLRRQQQRDLRYRIRDYRLKQEYQHVGRPMRIIGGTLLGLGAIAEVWGMTVLTTSPRGSTQEDGPFGNALGKPVAIAGAPLIVGGISLIIGANIKRNRAIRKAKDTNIAYSVSPKFMRDGVGVEGVVRF